MYIIKPKWTYEIYMNLEFSCDSSPSIEVKQPNHFAQRVNSWKAHGREFVEGCVIKLSQLLQIHVQLFQFLHWDLLSQRIPLKWFGLWVSL